MKTYAIIAQEPAAPKEGNQTQQQGSPFGMVLPLVLVLGVLYFLVFRPQRKKQQQQEKERQEMIGSLKKNDHVVTIGGLHGIVVAVSDEEVSIKVDEKNDIRVRVTREAIAKVVGREGEGADKEGGKAS